MASGNQLPGRLTFVAQLPRRAALRPHLIPARSPQRPIQRSPRVSTTAIHRPDSIDWHTELRSTLYSFVLGRDPNVSTVREIEASVYGIDPDNSTSRFANSWQLARMQPDADQHATNYPVWFFPLFSLFEIEIGV